MDQKSLRATVFLTVLLSAATSIALGQSKSLKARGQDSVNSGGDRFLDLAMVSEEDGNVQVQVHNETGGAILRGSVLINVAFASGTSQETRIAIANLGEGETTPVNVRLLTVGDERVEITGVEVVASKLRATSRKYLHVPIHVHYDAD